jgi:putative phosphoesterase
MRTIGVISDTHGLLRPEALDALAGSELIIHAGDVGNQEILDALASIAPVRAVRGNTDWGDFADRLPSTDVIDLLAESGTAEDPPKGPLAYLLHDHASLDLDPEASGFRMVIFGHTHEPLVHGQAGVLFLNPGSAGPRRFSLPVTVARLMVDADAVEAEIIHLAVGQP